MNHKLEELEFLLIEWETGTLDDEGIQRVRDILRDDPEARSRFVELQMIDAAFRLEGDAGVTAKAVADLSPQAIQPAARSSLSIWQAKGTSFWAAAALGVMVCILSGWLAILYWSEQSSDATDNVRVSRGDVRDDSEEATSRGVALVTRLVDAVWETDESKHEVGEALSPGRFVLASGYAQIEFFCGATVIVEGPAELDLQSSTLARVHRGRLRAHVPPAARGFTLDVDELKIVDLGTEFALSVSDEGANVQVYDGAVELHQPNQAQRTLDAGEAILRREDGVYEASDVTPDGFVDIVGLDSRNEQQRAARFERWREWSQNLRQDPRLITYYSFDQEQGWARRLTCDVEPRNTDLDGAIVGARKVAGRWDAKQGLEFKQPADRVRVQIPGEFESLTFACWVKIDSLDRWYNSLFLTDNYNQGEPHWQILDTGQLFFSVRSMPDPSDAEPRPRGPAHQTVISPPFWRPSLSGRWLHLATTYDVQAGCTTHYLNGEALHSEVIPEAQLVRTTRIGTASIGNWSLPTRPEEDFAIRNLNGSIDEFAIFAAALSADEIKEMYENGKP